MTLIRRSLYKELVTSRDELLSTLNTTKASLKTTEASLTTEQTFVDNFDKTQSDLAASKTALQASVDKLKIELSALNKKGGELETAIGKADTEKNDAAKALKSAQDTLVAVKKKGTAEEIAAQQKVVDEAQAVLDSKVKAYNAAVAAGEANGNSIADVNKQITTANTSISETDKQIADNKERNTNAPDLISTLTKQKDDLTTKVATAQTSYDDFIGKNKSTIDTFEKQQLQRDVNVPKVYGEPSQVFYRNPENLTVINEANTVMKEVIDDELKPANSAEESALKGYITAGAASSVNPDFLSAEDAKSLSLSVI
jgi:chromosome segregation ATPase